MTAGTVIVSILLICGVILAVCSIIRQKKSGKACGGCCGSCAGCIGCHPAVGVHTEEQSRKNSGSEDGGSPLG